MVFFDFECMILDGEHVPNFVVAETVCQSCQNRDDECEICGPPVVFRGDTTLDEFGAWVFRKENKGVGVFAHNLKVNIFINDFCVITHIFMILHTLYVIFF